MRRPSPPPLAPEDAQRIDNVLADSAVPADSRRALLRRASLGVAAFAGLAGVAGCGGSDSGNGKGGASGAAGTTAGAMSMSSGDQAKQILDTAITAEALAVTYLTAVVTTIDHPAVNPFKDVLKAANAAEYDHYKALKSLGAKPLTEKFWAPSTVLKPQNVFPFLETAETLFVNAYLIGTTTFAKAGNSDAARYAAEIGGVEAEHLALARFAQHKLPDDYGFMPYDIKDITGIVSALEEAGVGFGKKGSKPGQFVTFQPPPHGALVKVDNTKPQ